MNNNNTLRCVLLTTGLLGLPALASDAILDQAFHPYRDGPPTLPDLRPGMRIEQGNVERFKEALDPAMFDFVRQGWTTLDVAATTSFDPHPNYVEATRRHLGRARLGTNPGEIDGAIAGRPFPQEPDAADPRAGEKLAWNFKYGYNWGDGASISPFIWKYRDMDSGAVERTLTLNMHFLNFTHRVNQPPLPAITPNPSGLFRALYLNVVQPYDLRNTQLLIHRSANDLKRDNAWLYLGFQRRVRRLATGQVTDAFLGSDLMIEDFEGYNGRISDMHWSYQGTRFMLMPFYNHNDLPLDEQTRDDEGFRMVAFAGKGGCFPRITWQLRKVYQLQASPDNVYGQHPLSRRVHYVDAQTFTIPRTIAYDRQGRLWKTFTIGQAHPDHHLPKNKGSGVSLDDSFSMIDVQALHCTTGQFKGQVDPAMNPRDMFKVQHLRTVGG
ncbi:hypothetical protein D9M68_127730 [compost metagenome]